MVEDKLAMIQKTLKEKTGDDPFNLMREAYEAETAKYRENGRNATEEQIKRINGI